MFLLEDDDVSSIGAVAVADEADEQDTSSDASAWVKQYTDWTEVTPTPAAAPRD